MSTEHLLSIWGMLRSVLKVSGVCLGNIGKCLYVKFTWCVQRIL